MMPSRMIIRSNPPPACRPATPRLRLFPFALILTGLISLAKTQAVHGSEQTHQLENPAVATALVDVVNSFIAAGEKNDPSDRGKYLAPHVFFYGRARTREQAIKVIASLYRRWPRRKFT